MAEMTENSSEAAPEEVVAAELPPASSREAIKAIEVDIEQNDASARIPGYLLERIKKLSAESPDSAKFHILDDLGRTGNDLVGRVEAVDREGFAVSFIGLIRQPDANENKLVFNKPSLLQPLYGTRLKAYSGDLSREPIPRQAALDSYAKELEDAFYGRTPWPTLSKDELVFLIVSARRAGASALICPIPEELEDKLAVAMKEVE